MAKKRTTEQEKLKKQRYRARQSESRRLYASARKRAIEKGWTFSISVSDITVPELCPVFGTPLLPPSLCGMNPMMPSIDRIDSSRGYEPGNVQVLSHRANSLKSNATIEELEAVLAFLVRENQKNTQKHPN